MNAKKYHSFAAMSKWTLGKRPTFSHICPWLFLILPLFLIVKLRLPLSAQAADFNIPCDPNALINTIAAANSNDEADILELSPGCTYTLTSGASLITITTTILINGNGAMVNDGSFQVDAENGAGDLTLNSIAIINGGITNNKGLVTVNNASFSNFFGNAISNQAGQLTINSSRFVDGSAFGSSGNAIFTSQGGTTTVNNTTISNGIRGLSSWNSTLAINNSTISGNSTSGFGGGIYSRDSIVAINNSTISGNHAHTGGGIYNDSGTVTIKNGAIADNDASFGGGGVYIGSGATTEIQNTILAGNTIPAFSNGGGPDCWGNLDSLDFNLVQDTDSCWLIGATTNNITGQDPLLGPLQDNGGSTGTHHDLLPNSPAIDAANNAICPAIDQRGQPRPIDGNGDTTATCDIGAVEKGQASLADTDGDALPDIWEIGGLKIDGTNLFLDLPAMGANPLKKDIFIEVDYMVKKGSCFLFICSESYNHKPKPGAMARVVEAFANSPVRNPDGSTGVNLHLDFGPDSVMNPVTGKKWGVLSQANALPPDDTLGSIIPYIGDYDWNEFNNIKRTNFAPVRQRVFHYVVFGHDLPAGLAGISCNNDDDLNGFKQGASDFIVGLGPMISTGGTVNVQTGVFMHELGHNLGLCHGGPGSLLNDLDECNLNGKPNYLSVMNYAFVARGLTINGQEGHYDYSRFALPTLNENSLDETAGLKDNSIVAAGYGTRYWCDADNDRYVNTVASIDWNCDGDTNDVRVTENINEGVEDPRNKEFGQLKSYKDWESDLIFTGGGNIGTGTTSNVTPCTSVDALPIEVLENLTSPYRVAVTGQRDVVVPLHSASIFTFTVVNQGTQADTYSVDANSKLRWADVGNVPNTLSISPGAKAEIPITITVPTTANKKAVDELVLSAVSQANPLIEDVAIARTGVAKSLFLPLVLNEYFPGPDLIIDSLTATDNTVSLTIKNIGSKTVKEDFWVEVYFNPNPPPTGVNQIWDDGRSQYGLVWGVTEPIPAGGSLTLTLDDEYFRPSLSNIPSAPLENVVLYAQIDSANINTSYGAVLETHEMVGGAYNNIINAGPFTFTPPSLSQSSLAGDSQSSEQNSLPLRR